MPLTLEKQNAYRAQYAARRADWQLATAVYEQTIRNLLSPTMRVIDLGCGRGGVLEQLGSAVTFPFGIDPDWQSLLEHRLPHLPRIAAHADALPLRAGIADMILSSWVLEHLTTPEKTFQEVARGLKAGGYFIFITPNAHSLTAHLNRLLKPVQRFLVPRLYAREEADTFPVVYRANTSRQLVRLADAAGLHLVVLHRIKDPTYFAFHPVLFRLSVWFSHLIPDSMAEHLVGVLRKV